MTTQATEATVTTVTAANRIDTTLSIIKHGILLVLVFLPELAAAQAVPSTSSTFSGISAELKLIAQTIIFDWGYYIGIISLAIQGYRWKTGRIDTMHLLQWGCGIFLLFFAPNIVNDIKSHSVGTIQ